MLEDNDQIYDNSLSPAEVKTALTNATRRAGSYTRVVEEDGCAIYATLDYVVHRSLECLNKAIDKKLATEKSKYQNQLDIYNTLTLCKNLGVFNNISKLTADQLVNEIVSKTSCAKEVAEEIIKKPISYLTKSHDKEIQDLQNKLNEIQNHDRTKYLVQLYKDFRKVVLPIYESRMHSVTPDMMITNPCIKLDQDLIRVTDGDGIPFENEVYFVTDAGAIYRRALSTTVASTVSVQTIDPTEKVVGVVTDKSKYIKICTEFEHVKGYHGEVIVQVSDLTYDKKHINFRDESNERISKVEGLSRLSDKEKSKLKGTRIARTTWVKD